jgi:antitoxin CptB
MSNNSIEPTLEQRKVIYRARRGLKELDYYFDPYVRDHYLTASPEEQATFAKLVEQEDPDLLDWFLHNHPTEPEFADLIAKLKVLKAASNT